jgi:hypothetical protein
VKVINPPLSLKLLKARILILASLFALLKLGLVVNSVFVLFEVDGLDSDSSED